jgi:protein TonB
LRQYRLSVAVAAKRFKGYPALARERAWEGAVEITVGYDSMLPGPQVAVAATSGIPLLDKQALSMVSQAVRITPLPEGLHGRNFSIRLPVIYSLEGD